MPIPTLSDIQRNPALLTALPRAQKEEVLTLLEELSSRKQRVRARVSLLDFIIQIDPKYKIGAHHRRIAALLEAMARGEKDRLAVSIAPRMGKSYLISYYFPAWYLASYPDKYIMMVTNTADLAVTFGRMVRNLVSSDAYKALFPDITLAADSKSAGRWNTNHGGSYFAVGVGGAIAGRGADLLICDDPHDEQDILAGNTDAFDKTYEWFTTGARTRLMPNGRIAILHCMTGDTAVLMADGAEKPLREVRSGDMVASYDGGRVAHKKVLNWVNQGLDSVFTITLNSGNIVRANERHPFLVNTGGVEQWIKLRDLKPGMYLVSMRGAPDPRTTSPSAGLARSVTTGSATVGSRLAGCLSQLKNVITRVLPRVAATWRGQKQSPVYVRLALQGLYGTRSIQTHPIDHWGSMGDGRAGCVLPKGAWHPRKLKGFVLPAIAGASASAAKKLGWQSMTRKSAGSTTSWPGTVSHQRNTTEYLRRRTAGALSVIPNLLLITLRQIGKTISSLSTTATPRVEFVPCSAITATTSSPIRPASLPSKALLGTSCFTLDRIVSIAPCGEEEVFDIQVDGTENFLANGVVSHNTRWAKKDLIGRVIQDMVSNDGADQYEVVEFPAIIEKEEMVESPDPEDLTKTIRTPALVQKSIWPEMWSLEALLRTKASMPSHQWNAQYMQNPTSEEGAIVKREWWQWWEEDRPPRCDFIVQAWDTAFEKTNRSDYSACTTWGVWTPEPGGKARAGMVNVILLDAFRDRMEFPELKAVAKKHNDIWKPDALIVEKKASGSPLIYELRQMGLVVGEFTPSRGQDKIARLNAVSDMFSSGIVWVPHTRWAEEVIEETASFPNSDHDDYVDSMTLALSRVRQGGFVRLHSDEQDEVRYFKSRRRAGYY